MVKEVFDRSAALSGLLLLAPLLLVLGFAVWCHDHHSPFYLGRRVGRHGSQFHILKIRSMVADADRLGSSYTTADDSRITPIGDSFGGGRSTRSANF